MPSALIIGAGVSGLISAVLLAEHGWQVTVLEAHAIPGGLLQRFRRGPFRFDTGFHFLTGAAEGGPFRRLAKRLGILDRITFLPLEPEAQIRVHLPAGGEFAIPIGLAPAREAFCARWPEQDAALRAFFRLLEGGLVRLGWLAMLAEPGTEPLARDSESVSAALARCGVHGLPREVLGALSAILAMRPDACPLELYTGFAGTALAGCYRAVGGGEAVIAPLVERLKELGGKLLLKRAVTRIHFDEREVTAVEDARGEMHVADTYLASCHPEEVLKLTGPGGMRPTLAERVLTTPDSASAVLVFASLSQAPTSIGVSHHFAQLDDSELYWIAPSNFEGPESPPYLEAMLWVPCDAAAAWRDSERGKRPAEYEAWKASVEMRILDAVVAAHPDLAGTITRTWSSSPLSIRHYVRSRNGAAMGLSHDLGFLGSEPMPRRNRLRNLCFTGQSIGHPGVLGCMIEAFALCGHLIGKDLKPDYEAFAGPTR